MELGEAPQAGGTDDFASAPTTPLPVLGRKIPHEFRAVSPMTQAGNDLQAEGVELNDSSTISSESSNSGFSSRDGSNASSSEDGAPTPTAARIAARQLGAHMSRTGDGEDGRGERERRPGRLIRNQLRG